jgi:site-specific recombinase XerD
LSLRGLRPESIKTLKSTIKNFRDWLSECQPNIQSYKQLSVNIIVKLQLYRSQVVAVAASTIDKDIKNLCTIFGWAKKSKLVSENIIDYSRGGTLTLYKEQPSHLTYNLEDVTQLIDAAEQVEDWQTRDLVIALSSTGCRFEEIAQLRVEHIKEVKGVMMIRVYANNQFIPKHPTEDKYIPVHPILEKFLSVVVKSPVSLAFYLQIPWVINYQRIKHE